MAEKIVVAELDLDTEAFVDQAARTKRQIDQLKTANKNLDTSREEGRKQLVKNEVQLKKLNASYNEQKKVLGALTDSRNNLVKAEEAATKAINKQNKSIAEARKNNTELNKIRNNLNLTTKEGQKQLIAINKKLDANNKLIKENVDQYTQQKINIGNYGSALANTNPILSQGIGLMTQMRDALIAKKAAMDATTVSTNLGSKALKVFKLALISTGIGAIVVALGTLVAYLTSTQEGMDKVSVVTRQLGAALDVVIDRVIQVGGGLFKILNGDFAEGIDDITSAFDDMGTELEEEIALVKELEEAQQRLRDAENESILIVSKKRNEIAKLRFASKDESKSNEERIALLEEALKKEQEIIDIQVEFAKEREKLAQQEYDRATSDAEDFKELQLAKAEVYDLETASFKKQQALYAQAEAFREELRRNEETDLKKREANAQKKLDQEEKAEEQVRLKKEKEEADELARIQAFEDKKRDLENEIDLRNAETAEEKEILRTEQALEKELLALEKIQLDAERKTELKLLLIENEEQAIAAIREKYAKQAAKVTLKVDKEVLKRDQQAADARANVAATLSGILIGLLGDSLGAKLAAIAIEAGIQAGLIAITSSASQARNLATAASYGPPQNVGFMAAATAQNAIIAANSSAQITKVLLAGALQGFGTLAGSALSKKGKYEGGTITDGAVIPRSLRNSGGDDVLIQAKRGEVVLNETQQRRAGGPGFFNSIGVPGFATGGQVGSELSSSLAKDSLGNSDIISAIEDMKIVAIVDDIRDGVDSVVEIEDGANI